MSYKDFDIIRFRPNSDDCFAASMPTHYKPALFAFAVENLIYIVNRADFSENLIETPETTSKIRSLAFACDDKGDSFLFCSKENKFIYQISLNDFSLKNSIEISSVPYSLSAGIDRIFYLAGNNLYSYFIEESKPFLMAENLPYSNIISSLDGSAIALLTKGKKEVKIWYSPFSDDDFYLPLSSELVDFQWSCSHYLAAITACSDNSIKIWLQQPNSSEMSCIGNYTFSSQIINVAFVVNINDSLFISSNDKSIITLATPSLKRPKCQVIVTTQTNISICEEDSSSDRLNKIVSTPMPFNESINTICDLFYLYSNGEIRKRYDFTFFTKSGLYFHQIELSSKNYAQITPFQIQFMEKRVNKIYPFQEHLLTKLEDNTIYDWFDNKNVEKMTFQIEQFSGFVTQNNISVNEQIFKTNMKLHDMMSRNGVFIALFSNNCKGMLMFLKKRLISFDIHVERPIISASIHSSDIFAICTDNEVICYIYDNDKYQILAKLKADKPIARFIPNPYLLMAVYSDLCISFYIIYYNKFEFLSKINTVPIVDLVYHQNYRSFVAATDNMFYLYNLSLELPQQHSKTDNYVFFTSLTLGLFSVVSKIQTNQKVTNTDFVTKDLSYIFPETVPKGMPEEFSIFCPLNAPGWQTLDDNGRKFVFSYNLIKENDNKDLLYFFSIWAYLSNVQHLLFEPLHFEKCPEIYKSCAPLWVKDNNTLKKFIENTINKTYPSIDELDLYLLMCVITEKFSVAARVSNMHGNLKIASCFNSSEEIEENKIEKSAFEALKIHRYELAALFFVLLGKKKQAIHVLKNNPMLQLLVARVYDDNDYIQTIMEENFSNVINGFFLEAGNDKKGAVERLSNYELPKFEMLSLDAHRCEMIKEISKNIPKYLLLNLQFIPFFIKKHFIQSSTVLPENRVVFSRRRSRPSFHYDFDFGGIKHIDLDINFDGSEDEEEEEEETISDENVLIDSTHFVENFDGNLYQKNTKDIIITTSETYIVYQISRLFNVQFDSHTVKKLVGLIRLISDRSTIAAILFSLSFALSKTNFIIPLLLSYDFQIENYFDEFENCEVVVKPPDLLTQFVNTTTILTQNDIDIVNCLAFDKMSINLAKSFDISSNLSILPYFFHHRHRMLFKKLTSFTFSEVGIMDDIFPLQLDPIKTLQRMEKVAIHEKWLVALNSSFSSPFFLDRRFSFSITTTARSGIDPPVRGICIDKVNNQRVAVVSNSINTLKICSEPLDGKYKTDSKADSMLYFDSPFAPLLQSHNIEVSHASMNEKFECKWSRNRSLKTFVTATAVDSHPYLELFVTGESNGCLRVWNFTSNILQSVYNVKSYNSQISSLCFNSHGTNILSCDKEGRVFTSDFHIGAANLIIQTSKPTAAWFNETSQIAIVEPTKASFSIFDTKAGNQPVLTFDLDRNIEKSYPIDVWEHKIAIGCPDGRLSIFDIRNSMPSSIVMHSARIKAVKFHPSGTFLMTGGLDNKICFIDANNISSSECLRNVLPQNAYEKKSGICSISMSKQAIVVGGYSKALQVWTVVSEKEKAVSKSFSSAIDLRNITFNDAE